MKRDRFLSAIRAYCRKQGGEFRVDEVAGKGSHIKVWVDGRETIIEWRAVASIHFAGAPPTSDCQETSLKEGLRCAIPSG